MVAIHPSLTLVLDLDERLASHETKLEINRCYSHIGTPVVHTHEATEQDSQNVARFIVSMGTKKYLMSKDEGADDLWNTSVEPWIGSMLFKVSNNMAAFNRRMRKIGMPEIDFSRFDIELEGGRFVVSLVPDPENRIDRPVAAQVGLARQLLNEGVLADAVRVQAPGATPWATQEQAAREAWNTTHAAEKDALAAEGAPTAPDADAAAQTDAAEAAQPAQSGPMKHWVGPMPDRKKDPEAYAAWEAADREAKSYENTAVPPTDSDELPPIGNPVEPPEPERFCFDVDYTVWDVVDAAGNLRTFDSSSRTFCD